MTPDVPDPRFRDQLAGVEALRDALRIHHPIMRSETGPFSGCRCGAVKLGQDVIAHVVAEIRAAIAAEVEARVQAAAAQRAAEELREAADELHARAYTAREDPRQPWTVLRERAAELEGGDQ